MYVTVCLIGVRRTYAPKRKKVRWYKRKVHNEELCNVYFPPKWGSEPIIMLQHIHVLLEFGKFRKMFSRRGRTTGENMYIK